MRIPRVPVLVGGLCAVALALFFVFRAAPPATQAVSPLPGPKPGGLPADGFTLASVDAAMPNDTGTYPDGPHADVINANCLACHSASMALYQPRLSAEEWRKEVEKMRDAYGAPVDAADIPAIVAYLAAMSGKLPARPAAKP